jgi:NAD(P)-dependent dehydrogenase (short-subunit alcohol dehydrogenase family)
MDKAGIGDVLGYEGKRVVISGAATGMGAAATKILLDLGAEVIAADIKRVELPVKAFIEVDLRDKSAIERMAAGVPDRVDAVFSCAGIPGPPFSDLDVMLVNFVGARHLIELLVPKMQKGSAVATIASSGGIGWQQKLATWMELLRAEGFEAGKAWCQAHPDAIAGGYAPSKQAMNAWVCWRAATLIGQGIRLNTLNPGPTNTPMMPQFEKNSGTKTIEWATQPINRRSTPEEQAWPLVMLNSPRLSYVNGHAFQADGGWMGAVQTGQIQLPARMGK